MATETGPDLTAARRALERTMDDTCRIVLPETLSDVDLASAPVLVAESRCSVSDQTSGGSGGPTPVDDADDARRYTHKATLPADTLTVPEGAVLIVTSSRRDPQLVGLAFVVVGVKVTSWLVSRTLHLLRWQPVDSPEGEGPWPAGGFFGGGFDGPGSFG